MKGRVETVFFALMGLVIVAVTVFGVVASLTRPAPARPRGLTCEMMVGGPTPMYGCSNGRAYVWQDAGPLAPSTPARVRALPER